MRRYCCRWPSSPCVSLIIAVLVVSFVVFVATVALQWLMSSSPSDRRRDVVDEPSSAHRDGSDGYADGDHARTNVDQRQQSIHRATSQTDDHQRRSYIRHTGVLFIVIYLVRVYSCKVLSMTCKLLTLVRSGF